VVTQISGMQRLCSSIIVKTDL